MKKNKIIFALMFITASALFAEEYGLVLSGGGGKGAYEVGVWKALNEYGIAQKVTEISGTSVGGLNAALFACTTYERTEGIWRNMVPERLSDKDGSLKEKLISQNGLKQIIDVIPLHSINSTVWPRVIVSAVRKKGILANILLKKKTCSNTTRFVLNEEKKLTELQNKLLATAAFPVVCSPIKLSDGFEYTDGGEESAGGDNTPIDPIISNKNIQTVIVVYLNDNFRQTRRIRQIDYPSVKLIEIMPSIDLGSLFEGTVNFTQERIDQLIEQGYEDAVVVLRQKGYLPVASYWFESEE